MSDIVSADLPPQMQQNLRKLSTLSNPGRKDSLTVSAPQSRRSSGLLSLHPQHRKISAQSNASEGSNASDMSSLSQKIEGNSESFTDPITNILGTFNSYIKNILNSRHNIK